MENKALWFSSILAASALGITWLVRQRSREMNGLHCWQHTLAEQHGAARAQELVAAIRRRHAILLAGQPLPGNPALRRHLTRSILPGLALYQVLLQEYDGDQRTALAEIDVLFRAWTLDKWRLLLAPLKFLPRPFSLLRLAFERQMKAFPAEGWDFEFVENSGDRIAFNITRCFYLSTLTAHGAPELTASFCKGDDIMAEQLPPSICFVRSQTLGRGDEVCDFQYCRRRRTSK